MCINNLQSNRCLRSNRNKLTRPNDGHMILIYNKTQLISVISVGLAQAHPNFSMCMDLNTSYSELMDN